MTSSPPVQSPDADGPDRSVPQKLVDLAVLAIRRGAQRVALVHEGLGSDFHAPIGWLLWINQTHDGGSDLVTHQVGCDLSDVQAPVWLARSATDGTPDQPVIDKLVDLFQTGIKNGWSVTYERNVLEYELWQRTFKNRLPFGMCHKLIGNASNWGYDEAARDRGDQVSTEVSYSIREGADPDLVVFSNDGGTHRQEVSADHVEALLGAPAPDFVPVAYFDDDLDEWVAAAGTAAA